MKRESVNKFDLEAAFKALNEVEVPVVKGIRPNRENLQEKFTKKLVTDVLLEDYFDVNDSNELEKASGEREAEIAKAKLARIEKIVDLDAETEEDLLPSYVGKFIIQCPQCMTLFYKKEEDLEKSDENPEVVNLNEPCQHCGNTSGYTLIGKVDQVGEDEAAQYDVEDFEEDELNLDFDEESTEEAEETAEEPAEETEDAATEEEEVDLEPIEEPAKEEEEVKESLTEAKNNKQRLTVVEPGYQYKDADGSIYTLYGDDCEEDDTGITYNWDYVDDADGDIYIFESLKEDVDLNLDPAIAAKFTKAQLNSLTPEEIKILQNPRDRAAIDELIAKYNPKYVEESLNEDVDLNKQLDLYNDFIKYLQKMVEQDEDALEEAKKLGNKEVIAAIEKRLENSKAELKAALPTTVKDEVTAEELPTPEEADMEDATENKEDDKKEEKKESLTEDIDTKSKLDAEEAALEKTNVEDIIVEAANSDVVKALDKLEADLTEALPREPQVYDDKGNLIKVKDPKVLAVWAKVIDQAEADGITSWNDYATQKRLIDKALTSEEKELLKTVEFEDGILRAAYESLNEAKFNVSDADFRAMLKNPVFNEGCKKELEEDLPPVNDAAFERATDAIEMAGSELTPEEQKMEDAELAAKDQVEESLTEELHTWICWYEGNDIGTVEAETEEEAQEEMMSKYPEYQYNNTDWGVSLESDELDEAAPQGEFVSKLKRNYSATELMVKELKEHPLFSSLSTRTIQRVLLPYYIENMGRKDLSAQAMVDFYTEEGFAPYVFDHFTIMDPLVRKELLLADAKFMEIFNDWAKEYGSYPSGTDELAPGEDKFGYALDTVFLLDAGKVYKPELTGKTIAAFSKMYANGKFDAAVAEANHKIPAGWDDIEDFDDDSFDMLTEKYLTEVYSNVKSFKATSCSLEDNKLIVEGKLTFNSGKTKNTTFIYEAKETANEKVILEGLNTDFAAEKAFTLNCKVDTANCLIVESLNYKYSINNTLVEGLLK